MSQGGKNPYGYYGVYGSLAYDFRPIGNERAGDYSKVKASRIKSGPLMRAMPSPAFAVALILCAFSLGAALLAQSALVELSSETVSVQQEIKELLDERTLLEIRHTELFSPAATERYAVEELGMCRPSGGQICYIDVAAPVEEGSAHKEKSLSEEILSLISAYFPG